MKITISPSVIKGEVTAPPSKSYMQRACAAALLKKGISEISNLGTCNDDLTALQLLINLGVVVDFNKDSVLINNERQDNIASVIHCGESGLGVRMFTPILALRAATFKIDGYGSLLNRPVGIFQKILPSLGVQTQTQNGKLPLIIKGPLKPDNIHINGNLSSQFLTGLLMAYSGANASDVTIRVDNLNSKPYIDLTLDVLRQFKLKVPVHKNYKEFYFPPGEINLPHEKINFAVEGDWSNAAFLLVAAAFSGSVTVSGLKSDSLQADKAIIDALQASGAAVDLYEEYVTVRKQHLTPFFFDATHCPDLFPPLVALAANCKGISKIKGAERLYFKESNRVESLTANFAKMGIQIRTEGDIMEIHGGVVRGGAQLHSYNDHRIVMACVIAGLTAIESIEVEDAQAINKSYPKFFEDMDSIGAIINYTLV